MKTVFWKIVCLVLFGLPFYMSAQDHLAPGKGANGIPGTIPGSFIIQWGEVPSAVAYEYVLTNNELCYTSCPGDTRQEVVTATDAIEFNLHDSTYYFWITRVIFENGDTSNWTLPSFFFAVAPDRSRPLAVASQPAEASSLTIRIDWSALPETDFLTISAIDMRGEEAFSVINNIRPKGNNHRFSFERFPVSDLRPGVYVLRAHLRLRGGGEEFRTVKFQVY